MADAKRDQNNVPTLLGTLDSTGASTVRVKVNATNHALKVSDNTTGSDNGPSPARALRDNNDVPALLAVSSVDGVSIVPVYADSNGNLLIDSN